MLDRTFGELKFSLDGAQTLIVINDEKLKTAELKLYLKVQSPKPFSKVSILKSQYEEFSIKI